MAKGKWTAESRARARQREELKQGRIAHEMNRQRRLKLINFDTWFSFSCEIAKKQKFDWYKDAPQEVKEVVINMCYQLGINGFSKFKQTIYYLETEQYPEASEEMLDSLWYRQTPNRAKELSDTIKYIGKERIL